MGATQLLLVGMLLRNAPISAGYLQYLSGIVSGIGSDPNLQNAIHILNASGRAVKQATIISPRVGNVDP